MKATPSERVLNVTLTHYRDYAQFKEIAIKVLAQKPAMHQLALGVLERGDEPLLMAIAEEGEARLVILQTIEEQAILAGEPLSREGMRKLSRMLDLNGYVGEHAVVEPIIEPYSKYELHMDQGIYALTAVIPPRPVDYEFRLVTASAVEQAVRFGWAFIEETGVLPLTARSRLQNEQSIRRHVEGGTLYGLFDGTGLIAMTSVGRPTKFGITVSYVYTPPEHRGKGLASFLVAAVSEEMLKKGFPLVSLYTDWANPTSNKIYQAIGYELIGRSSQYRKKDRYR